MAFWWKHGTADGGGTVILAAVVVVVIVPVYYGVMMMRVVAKLAHRGTYVGGAYYLCRLIGGGASSHEHAQLVRDMTHAVVGEGSDSNFGTALCLCRPQMTIKRCLHTLTHRTQQARNWRRINKILGFCDSHTSRRISH